MTIHPAFVRGYCEFGVFAAALRQNLAAINVINLRDFAVDRHGTIDERPYGGGDSMVIRPEPLAQAIHSITPKPHVVLTSAGAPPWTHEHAARLAEHDGPLAIVCARFAGVDQRFIDRYVDEEFSFGDFIVSGGELPGLMILDSMLRLIPGTLGNEDSSQLDSFSPAIDGLLEGPLYTRPQEFEGVEVPAVLMSGDHEKIAAWHRKASIEKTLKLRPDLLKKK